VTESRATQIASLEREIRQLLKKLAELNRSAGCAAAAELSAKARADEVRDSEIAHLYEQALGGRQRALGADVNAIAQRFGLTPRRVRQIARKGPRTETTGGTPWDQVIEAVLPLGPSTDEPSAVSEEWRGGMSVSPEVVPPGVIEELGNLARLARSVTRGPMITREQMALFADRLDAALAAAKRGNAEK
jgi:hypothetical protein